METTGLVIGIAGLAGLFSACLDLIEVAQSYESFDDDSKDLDAQFDGYKVHFQRWGRSVGLLETGERQERSHHQGLDGPVISKEVKTLLERINKHFKEEVLDERRQAAARATGEGLSTVVSAPHAKPSRWEKVNWVLRGRAKRIKEVAWFGETVGLLYNLVPIDNHAAYPDKSDWNKLQTALAHIEQDLEQQIHGRTPDC